MVASAIVAFNMGGEFAFKLMLGFLLENARISVSGTCSSETKLSPMKNRVVWLPPFPLPLLGPRLVNLLAIFLGWNFFLGLNFPEAALNLLVAVLWAHHRFAR